MTWLEQAACKDTDTAIFYPVPEAPIGRRPKGQPSPNLYDAARAICAQCPVTEPCLKAAMTEEKGGQRFGMRAGLTWRERSQLPRRTCGWCREWFDVPPMGGRGGKHPTYCTDDCRDAAKAEVRRQANERQRVERWTDLCTECEVCGFESRTTSGLAAHRRQLHGIGAVA